MRFAELPFATLIFLFFVLVIVSILNNMYSPKMRHPFFCLSKLSFVYAIHNYYNYS